jgi:cytochrome c biogenesis protein CcdA
MTAGIGAAMIGTISGSQLPVTEAPTMALFAAVLLGLRHVVDPDHLTAVATLALQERGVAGREAGTIGLCWGLGHAVTLMALGLPVVWLGRHLPGWIHTSAEVAIGVLIAALAARLLVRWRRGYFHSHPHTHDGTEHAHPHAHEHAADSEHPVVHEHAHADTLGRSPLAAFGIGLVHGVGGSAVAGVLLVAATPQRGQAALVLGLFALTIALAMAVVSAAFGHAVGRARAARRFRRLVPTLATASLLFGIWYAAAAAFAG